MNKQIIMLREFAKYLSDDEIKILRRKIDQNLQGDLNDVFDIIHESQDEDVIEALRATNNSEEIFDLMDYLFEALSREAIHRSIDLD